MTLKFPAECPVCKSRHIALAKRIDSERGGATDVYYCMECESFCSPFAAEHLNGPTLNHHLRVRERNVGYTQTLFEKLAETCRPRRVLDVGCGIGTLLHAAREAHGIDGVGFDLDEAACAYGRENFQLDLRGQAWTPEADVPPIELITCIMVLEHIKWPRPVINDLLKGARKYGCPVFVSVPWFNRAWWKFLTQPVEPGSPLYEPWVHVTHFSEQGFVKVCRQLGATSVVRLGGIAWPGYLMRCD